METKVQLSRTMSNPLTHVLRQLGHYTKVQPTTYQKTLAKA